MMMMIENLLRGYLHCKPLPCHWLSEEREVLPKIVNVVSTVELRPESPEYTIDMYRVAEILPNVKYQPKNFAAITMRLGTTAALLFKSGKVVLIRTNVPEEARYYSHLYRELLESIPMYVRNTETGEVRMQTLRGHLQFRHWKVENIVGNGVLQQNGVHLTNLLESGGQRCRWEPDSFPNLNYRDTLPNGVVFVTNISDSAKVVIMGVKAREDLYNAFRRTNRLVAHFEDPNAPKDPKKRFRYRMDQLTKQRGIKKKKRRKKKRKISATTTDGDSDDGDANLTDLVQKFTPIVKKEQTEKSSQSPKGNEKSSHSQSLTGNEEDLSILMEACDAGQVANVEFLMSNGLGIQMLGFVDSEGRTAYDRIKDSNDPAHCTIARLLKNYMS